MFIYTVHLYNKKINCMSKKAYESLKAKFDQKRDN